MIGERIRRLRKMFGMKQTEFAKKIGITSSALSQIEHGKRKPSYEVTQRIIDRLGIEPRALFKGR